MTDAPNKPGSWTNFRVPASAVKFDTTNTAEKTVWILDIKEIYGDNIDIKNINPHKFFQDIKDRDMVWIPNFESETIYYIHKDHELADTQLSWQDKIKDDNSIAVSWFRTMKLLWQENPTLYVLDWKTTIYASVIEKNWLPRVSRC